MIKGLVRTHDFSRPTSALECFFLSDIALSRIRHPKFYGKRRMGRPEWSTWHSLYVWTEKMGPNARMYLLSILLVGWCDYCRGTSFFMTYISSTSLVFHTDRGSKRTSTRGIAMAMDSTQRWTISAECILPALFGLNQRAGWIYIRSLEAIAPRQ